MRGFRKIAALILAAAVLATFVPFSYAAQETDYKITNPYAEVDFGTWNQYKTDLHCHTTFSDGRCTLPETVERHYELGFDIMAITDHGTVNYGFTNQTFNQPLRLLSLIKNKGFNYGVLSESGTAANGKHYTVWTKKYGKFDDEFYKQDGDETQTLMRVPYGNEQNPTSFNNAHVNTWFVDYGHGVVGGTSNYVVPISRVDKLGGLSIINHPGEYSDARDELYTKDAYDVNDPVYNYKINKFANILKKYRSCIGIDINSKGDHRTRFDRKLWDILLQKVVPSGRNVFAIGSTDAHSLGIVDSGYVVALMPSLTNEDLKKTLERGSFFAASKYIGNYDELIAYSRELETLGSPEALNMSALLKACADKIDAEVKQSGEPQDTEFKMPETQTPDSEFPSTTAPPPKVKNVKVDETDDVIEIETENALLTRWIADGAALCVGNRIDLDDYSDKIGSYVRAEILGEGGIMYSQPFILDYDGAPEPEKDKPFFDWGIAVSLICDTPVKLLLYLLPLKCVLDVVEKIMTK